MNLFDNNQGAEFSPCNQYRYRLWRIWNNELPIAMVIGLNPSTANSDKNDPTIDNLIRVLVQNEYGGFYMMNCFPLISSKPEALKDIRLHFKENDLNNWHLKEVSKKCKIVILAWGNFKIISELQRDKELIKMFPDSMCLGINKNGSPCHPLALMYSGKIKTAKIIPYQI